MWEGWLLLQVPVEEQLKILKFIFDNRAAAADVDGDSDDGDDDDGDGDYVHVSPHGTPL